MSRRLDRLNSLLKEVISDVIRKEIKNPHLSPLLTITEVEVTKDLQHAKVFVSVIGAPSEKAKTIAILQTAAPFIKGAASRLVTLRYFPNLTFLIDESIEKQIRMEEMIFKIQQERESRENG